MVAPSEFSAQNFIDPSQSFALPLTNTHTPHTPPTHTQRHKGKKYWYNIHLWFTFFFCHVSNPPTKSLFFLLCCVRSWVSECVCATCAWTRYVSHLFLPPSLYALYMSVCVCVLLLLLNVCRVCLRVSLLSGWQLGLDKHDPTHANTILSATHFSFST